MSMNTSKTSSFLAGLLMVAAVSLVWMNQGSVAASTPATLFVVAGVAAWVNTKLHEIRFFAMIGLASAVVVLVVRDEYAGLCYLVATFLAGSTLREWPWISDGQLSPEKRTPVRIPAVDGTVDARRSVTSTVTMIGAIVLAVLWYLVAAS